jgi:hypothetical protein
VYFTHLKCQRRIEDEVGDISRYVFTKKKLKKLYFFVENDPLVRFIHLLCKNMTTNPLKCILLP